MDSKEERPEINKDWDQHYIMLEYIRKSGVKDPTLAMFYLMEGTNLSGDEADQIVRSWVANYDALARRFRWK